MYTKVADPLSPKVLLRLASSFGSQSVPSSSVLLRINQLRRHRPSWISMLIKLSFNKSSILSQIHLSCRPCLASTLHSIELIFSA